MGSDKLPDLTGLKKTTIGKLESGDEALMKVVRLARLGDDDGSVGLDGFGGSGPVYASCDIVCYLLPPVEAKADEPPDLREMIEVMFKDVPDGQVAYLRVRREIHDGDDDGTVRGRAPGCKLPSRWRSDMLVLTAPPAKIRADDLPDGARFEDEDGKIRRRVVRLGENADALFAPCLEVFPSSAYIGPDTLVTLLDEEQNKDLPQG